MRFLTLLLFATALFAQTARMPQLKLEDTTGEQRALAEQMLKQTRSGLTGPFNAMLRSPEMSKPLMELYLYFRYKTALPRGLVELAILITGRYPRGLFDFVVGVARWALRVSASRS